MTAPFFPASTTTLAVAGTGATSYLAWILITGVICIVAVVGIARRPAAEWPHRLWSKVGWVLVVVCVAVPVGGYPIPLGAIAAIWHTYDRQTHRPAQLPDVDSGSWEGK